MFFLVKNILADENNMTILEADVGGIVRLPCENMGDNHRFMIWQLPDDQRVIGPNNSFDHNKYNYKVLSGELFIKVINETE